MSEAYEVIGRWVVGSACGQEQKVMNGVSEVLSQFNTNSVQIEDILTSVSEACLNAMEHGNGWNQHRNVSVAMMASRSELVFRVHDEGLGCIPPSVPTAKEEKLQADNPRGWGIYLMSSLADSVNYMWDQGQFCVEIHFNRK